MTIRDLLEQAIQAAGSEAKLAVELGVSQVAVNKAKQAGRVSPTMALRLERVTGISRAVWRPDLWEAPAQPEAA